MNREQKTNSRGDVLANVGDSLLEGAPSRDEERVALDRVWSGLRWKANHVPAEAVRSVELGKPSERQRVEGAVRWDRRSTVRALAAAAMVIVAVGAAMLWPRGVQAYTAGADGLQVTLADDSRVEMRAHAEMTVARESDGIQIDLRTGDIIITAARQRDGHLYVRTGDMTIDLSAGARRAKANGTVFLASAGQQGSRVGVIEGEVRVREGSVETLVRPGEQIATSPVLAARTVRDDIRWSRYADEHLAKVDSFMRGVALTTGPLAPLAARQADVAAAQTPGAKAAAQEFEEASIRPCDPDNMPATVAGGRGGSGPNSVYMTPGRFYGLCLTAATLIRTAYGYRSWGQEVDLWFLDESVREVGGRTFSLQGFGSVAAMGVEDGRRVRGGPDWMRTERYTVEAVAGAMPVDGDACFPRPADAPRGLPPPTPGNGCRTANANSMSGPMLRALLERRFGLKAHIETEQSPAYSLVVAPGGLRMKEGACNGTQRPAGLGDTGRARWFFDVVRLNLDAARRGDVTTGSCGLGVADNGPNRIVVGAGAGLPPLQETLEAPVFNRTGIPNTTRFNYALEYLVEQTLHPFRQYADDPPQMSDNPSSVQPAPNFFTALEQQLGLRLERTQVPRDYIVIDAIKRLEPN